MTLAKSAGLAAPVRSRRDLQAYNVMVALYLAYLGFSGGSTSIPLWPAVIFHMVMTVLLARAMQRQLRQ
jgi:hypothetical protein